MIDQRIAQSKQPLENTKVSTQGAPMKDPRAKKPKFKNQNSKPADSRPPESVYKARKDSKKDQHSRGRERAVIETKESKRALLQPVGLMHPSLVSQILGKKRIRAETVSTKWRMTLVRSSTTIVKI